MLARRARWERGAPRRWRGARMGSEAHVDGSEARVMERGARLGSEARVYGGDGIVDATAVFVTPRKDRRKIHAAGSGASGDGLVAPGAHARAPPVHPRLAFDRARPSDCRLQLDVVAEGDGRRREALPRARARAPRPAPGGDGNGRGHASTGTGGASTSTGTAGPGRCLRRARAPGGTGRELFVEHGRGRHLRRARVRAALRRARARAALLPSSSSSSTGTGGGTTTGQSAFTIRPAPTPSRSAAARAGLVDDGAADGGLGGYVHVHAPGLTATAEYKPLLDDTTWARGPNYHVSPGETVDVWPHFTTTMARS